ncbi:hypothetical protein ACHQM5_021343 [Ranunculus cassubicifolius]
MWFLSRNPTSITEDQTKPFSSPSITCRTSIFPPTADTGIFEDISVVQLPNNSHLHNNPWQWYAHHLSPSQFHAIVLPQNPSFNIQIIAVSLANGRILCALIDNSSPQPFANFCMFSRHDNVWDTDLKIKYDVRNPMVAASSIIGDCLYLAGGCIGNPSCVEPVNYLNSAERLNLETAEWEDLPAMKKARSSAKGIAYKGKFYVVGGANNDRHSAEIYDPTSNSWQFVRYFMPSSFDGYAISSMNNSLLILVTLENMVGVKVWMSMGLNKPSTMVEWGFIGYHPEQVERQIYMKNGVRLVQVGTELWMLPCDEDEFGCSLHVDGASVWPTFPGPMFVPGQGCSVKENGHVHAFSSSVVMEEIFVGGVYLGTHPRTRLSWRKVPVYSSS